MNQNIDIRISSNADSAANFVASEIANLLKENPSVTLGLATGGTPVEVYRRLVEINQRGDISFADCTTFNLDEYVGLEPDHDQSYRYFMQKNLFDYVDVNRDRTHVPDGVAVDLQAACSDYESRIKSAGGIDLQLLGIGMNGHIAFNEPGSDPNGRTSVVELTDNTIAANSRFFEKAEDVPRQAVTLGIGTILEADRIILMATGSNKAEAVARALVSEPNLDSPASYLQTKKNVTFVLDAEAARLLPKSVIEASVLIT